VSVTIKILKLFNILVYCKFYAFIATAVKMRDNAQSLLHFINRI